MFRRSDWIRLWQDWIKERAVSGIYKGFAWLCFILGSIWSLAKFFYRKLRFILWRNIYIGDHNCWTIEDFINRKGCWKWGKCIGKKNIGSIIESLRNCSKGRKKGDKKIYKNQNKHYPLFSLKVCWRGRRSCGVGSTTDDNRGFLLRQRWQRQRR